MDPQSFVTDLTQRCIAFAIQGLHKRRAPASPPRKKSKTQSFAELVNSAKLEQVAGSLKRKLETPTPVKRPNLEPRSSLGTELKSGTKRLTRLQQDILDFQSQQEPVATPAGKENVLVVKLHEEVPKPNWCILCDQPLGKGARRLMCRHKFHSTCIVKYFRTQSGCPECKANSPVNKAAAL